VWALRARRPRSKVLKGALLLVSAPHLQGFAYVEFGSAEDLGKACALHATEFRGKTLFVAPSRPPGGGGGGRGGGGEERRGQGGRGGGRGRDGAGGGGRGRGRGGAPRGVLDLGAEGESASKAPHPRAAAFVPRSAALLRAGGGVVKPAPAGAAPAVASNAEFRSLLLPGGGGGGEL
jgi:hypothetical protein